MQLATIANLASALAVLVAVFFGSLQWLAERLDEYPSPGKSHGAHLAHRRWRP